MDCFNENNADLLIGYFEKSLPEAERLAVEAHAAGCADCHSLLSLHRTLDGFAAPEISSNFDAKLYARIEADRAKPWWHVSNWKLVIPVTAVAAMFAVGVFMMQRPPVEDPTKQASVDQVQQLEQALDDLELLMPLPPKGAI